MNSLKTKLSPYAPIIFNDGLVKCNELGKKLLLKKKVNRFLDLGCGEGNLTMEFAKIIKPKEIYGIEFLDDFRQQAEKKRIKCIKHDLNKPWKYDNNFFDLILSSQNIEHLHNTRLYLEECYRCLSRDGQILILTENLASWANIGALIFGWQPFSTTCINGLNIGNPLIWHANEQKNLNRINQLQNTGISGLSGHVRVLSFIGLKNLLEQAGFKNINIFTRGYFPFKGLISDFLCKIDKKHGHFLIASAIKQ